MATDSTNVPQTEASAGNDHQEFNPENIQLAQANTGGAQQPAAGAAPQADIPGVPNGSVNVAFPEGQNIVRVQVAPGETISIPFDGDLAAKFGEEGNLAIKVGDRTIILQGYAEANQETGVTLKDESGDDIDVASVIAATDPNLDIQTAAGGTAGGSTGGSGFFSPFSNAGSLGGLGELGVLGQTELQYGLIQPDANILLQEPDTDPTLVSITFDFNDGVVNEDDLSAHHPRGQEGNGQESERGVDFSLDGDLLSRLGQNVGEGLWQTGHRTGNDPFDTTDHENGSQTDSQDGVEDGVDSGHSDDAVDNKGHPIDQDREPTTAKAAVTVDFHGDVPGKVTFSNGANVPVITQLEAQNLTSHGHPLQYALLPAANGQGEMIVAYYTTENGIHHLVFTLGIEEGSGATSPSTFHIDFTSYDAIDNLGASADILNIGVPFFMSDSDGSVVAVPAGPNGLNFQYVDDVPELGHVRHGEDGTPTNIVEANLTIGHDETAGNQHTKYQDSNGNQQKADDTNLSNHEVNSQVKHGLANNGEVAGHINSEFFKDGDPSKGFKSDLVIGSAQMQLDVSFGADGKARGNEQAGKTIFAGDGDANAQAFEIYMQAPGATSAPDSGNQGDAAQDHVRTNLTIDVNGEQVPVDAYQLDANTIIGISTDGQPVFVIHVDPKTGEVTLTQYHQMHNLDGSDANDPVHLQDENGNPLVHFRATDYDGDHVDGQLDVSFIDDKPRVTGCDVDGNVAESALHDGNRDNPGQVAVAAGSLKNTVDFGADKDGTFSLNLNKNGELTKGALESLTDQHLTSHGHELQYKMEDGKLVGYITDSHGNTHDVFTLEVKPNGDYTFTLVNQLDHPAPGQDIKDIDLGKVIKATDSDGDSVVLKNGQLEIHVEDDKPVSTCRSEDGTVSESALWDGNREGPWQHASTMGSLKNTVDFGADNHGKFSIDFTAAQAVLGQQNLESHGQDLHYMMDGNTLVGYIGSESNPHVIFTLTVDENGNYKFELKDQLDHADHGRGDDVIDIDFSGIIKATDEDGDSIHLNNGQFEVHVKDDQPVSTCRTVDDTVDESALSDGNRDNPWQTKVAYGNLGGTVDFGADNHGKFSIDLSQSAKQSLENQHLTSHGQELHYTMQGGTLVAFFYDHGQIHQVFTLTVDSNGNYKFELKDQLDHVGRGNGDVIDIDFSGIIKATDEDYDSIHLNNGQFEIHVKDDQPVATCNNVDGTVDESALSDGNKESNWQHSWTAGSLKNTVDFGADNHGKFSIDLSPSAQQSLDSQHLSSHGQELHYTMQNGVLVGYTGTLNNPHVIFTLSVDSDGDYKFELKDQLDHVGRGNGDVIDIDFSGIIKATDEDYDSIHLNNGQFEIHVKDDQPVSTCRDVDGTVDESALSDGNRDNPWQTKVATGDLSGTVDFGADNHGKFSIDLSQSAKQNLEGQHLQSHGQDLHYMMQGNTLVGYTGDANNPHVVFTLTVDSDGDYRFELKDQLDHKGPGNNTTIDIDFSDVIKATDEDYDSIHLNNGQFEIHVKDDTPTSTICVADHGGVTIDESAGQQENDKTGSVPSIFNGVTNHDAPMGWAQSTGPVVKTTVSFGADDKGSESLTLGISKNGVDSGLTTTDGHHIYLFKEGNLVVGREDGANGKAAFALSMDASGKLTIVQYEPIHQNNPNDPNDAVHIKDGALQVTYTVTDGDGDKDSHTVNIGDTVTFKDDGPSKFSVAFSGNDNTVDESALTTGNPNDEKVTFHFNYQNNGGVGADGLGSVTFALNNPGLKTASGEVVHTQMVDGVLVGYTGNDPHTNHVFTITDNHNGTYTFELEQPLQNNGAQNDQISLNLTATVTDGDGDSQSSNFTIKVNDDTPGTPCVVSHDPNFVFGEGRIDEDYLPTGNHDGDTNPDNVGVGGVIFPGSHYDDMGGTTVGGSVVADYGADGPGGLSLTSLKVTSDAILGNTLLNVNIDPVTHAVTGTNNLKASDGTAIQLVFDGTTLTGYAGNQHDSAHAVFTFTLNANGTWSYTLLQGLDHPIDTSFSFGGLDTRPEDNLHFSFGVTATDKDGDAKTGYVNVNVDDDGPQAGNFTLGTFQEHSAAQDLGTVEQVFGGHFSTGADGLGNIQITGGNGAGHGTLTIVNGHVYYTPPSNVTGNQSYNFEYTVTDRDGDRSTATITVGVKDNVPTITHQDPYPNDPNNGNGELTLSESHLADGTQPDSGLLSKNGVFTIDTHGEGLGSIQINGNTVTDGSQIPGDKGTLVIDHITDNHDGTYSVSYHYTVDDNHLLSNPNDTFNQQFNITVKDASGDSASSTITVHVTDDAPKAGAPVTMAVDEDALDAAHGHNGSAGIEGGPGDIGVAANHATVQLGTVFGADGKGSVAIDTSNLPQIKSDGHNVQYELSGDGHTLTGYITYESEGHTSRVDVLTLAIDGDGSEATFTLLAPIDHPDHGQTGSLEDNSTLNFGYTVTDGDGDKASGQINVIVNDDTPTASCVEAPVVKEPTDGGQTGHETYTIDTSHYDASTGNNTGNTLHISAGYVDANGNYVDALPGQDNDPASVNVNGDSGSAYGGTTGFGTSSNIDGSGQDRFDEVNYLGDSHTQTSEALVISLAQDGKVATSATVNLAEFYPNEGNIGDEQGAYRLYLNGQPVSDWISFTAENGNGSLALTINGPASGFDKIVFAGLPATSNPNGDQNGSDSSDFSIHDATFHVVDADSIHGSVNSVHGDLSLAFGADGPGHVDLTAHGETGLTYNGQPITETVQNGVLYGKAGDTVIYTLSITHDESGYHYQFDLAKPIDGSQTGHPITFDYSVTDNDGDKVGGCITVNIDDNNGVTINLPTDAAGVTQVDEAGLAAGTHHGDGSNIANGHIAVNAPDGVTSIKLGGVTIPLDGTVVQITDGTRGTLDAHWNAANHTIDYTYTLTGSTTEGGDDKASFQVVVTDPQGDHNTGQNLVITIHDDAPIASDDGFNPVTAQMAAGQDIGNILTNDKTGADGYGSPKITSVEGGVSDGNGGFTITNDKGTIHVAADGTVTFDSKTNHSYGAGEVLGFDYTIQDGDGDPSTAHASFTVSNPSNPQVPHVSDLEVNESQLLTGTHQGGGSTTDGNSFTVPAGFSAQTGTFNLPHGTLTVTQTGNTVSYSYTLTKAVDDGTTGSSDGQNTVDNADTHTVHLTGPFGQTIDVTVNVDVKDDVPTAQHADLGSFDENSGAHIGHVDFNAGADGLQSVVVTEGNGANQGTLAIDADGKVTYTPPTDVNGAHDYTFTYQVTDKDGDKATNTITVHVNDTAKPVLIVGENVDDNSGQQKDHYIDHAPSDQNQGTINGGDAGDVLVGDVGGKSGQIAAGDYNICLILDVSTSMNDTFAGSGGKSRLDVMQAAVDELLAKYADHPGDVNIKIIAFGTDVVREWNSNANGDFTSTTTNNGQTAIQFVDGLDNRGIQYTNYEAAMEAAKAWFDQVGNNGNTNKAYFLSDGDPTARLDNNGNVVDLNANPSDSKVAQYISEALGAAGSMLGTGNDGLHVDFQAIGIGSGVTKTNLDKFDNSGDTQTPGDAQIVNNASDLNDALDVGKAPVPFDQGDDVINGGKGNDLIFGDEVYTESINDNNPNTIGWQNFGNMTEAQIVAWLKANPDEAGKEYAGAKYGNDTLMGGEGDDVIYGQGGDDIITGGKGTDQLHGGSGNDTYIWAVGDGNDTIMETAGTVDTVKIAGTDTNPTLTKNGNDLVITIGGETITVKGQFETDGDNNPDTNKAVEFIEVNGVTYRVTLDQNGQPKLTELAPPVNTVPNSVAVNTGVTAIGGVSVADIDSQLLTVTLAVDHGAITLASMVGLTFDAGDGTNDGTMTFHGTQDAINAALAGLKYTSDGNDATLTMTSKDGEGHTDTDQIAIHAVDANLNLSIDHGSYGSNSTKYTGNDDYSTSTSSDRHIIDAASGGSHNDNGGGHTISGGSGDDWIEAGKGDDDLYGNNGNDYLDGGQGHDTYRGGAGNDVLLIDRDDLTGTSRLIDGGTGDDVVRLPDGDWDFRGNNYGNTGHKGIANVETLDLSGGKEQHVTLDADSVLDMTDGRHTLVIQGDNNDNVTLNGDWNKVGSVTDHGHTYDVFQSGSGGNLATVIVDQLIHTTTPDHHG